MGLAALEATLRSYIDPIIALKEIPILNMLNRSEAELKQMAEELSARLKKLKSDYEIEILPKKGQIGGGSLPDVELPSWIVAVKAPEISTVNLAAALRTGEPNILGYINNDYLCLDSRTLLEGDIENILTAFQHLK